MKSSWVLENKQGVCDELTSLFMSLCRSLGIPTKFVSGMSYTDLELFSSPWGPHGWSEVYFPDIGWVPFDVTYRQMGYLDATHIKLREAPDAKDSSIEYLSRGRDIKIKGGPLNINVETLKKGVKVVPNIDINVFVKYEDVGFGSYNLVWAEIKNLHEYYVTADLALSRTNELKVVYGKHKTSLLLRPLEKKKVYWIVQVDENLKQGWSYKFPVELRDIRGAESLAHFNSLRTDPIYSYIEIKNLIPRSATKPEKRTEFECIAPESRYNIDAEITITCTIKNLQTARKQYNICLDTNCKDELIQGGEEKTIQFARRLTKPGINNIVVSAEHGTEQKRSYLLLDVLVEPKINVTDLEYPKTIEFKDEGKIIFTIRKNQDSVAKNIKVTLVHDKVHMQKNFQEILQPQEFSILFYGSNLKGKNNDFEIVIDYEDDQGKKFQTVEKFTIEIVNLTFFQKFMLFIDDLENKVFH
ncbi:MAG: transglutaminase-like domain-containing protein [Nanoarchaeota archaeon]|nr:transglutaminase-like domain-containing protein [Nanoarchaeota archaeon]